MYRGEEIRLIIGYKSTSGLTAILVLVIISVALAGFLSTFTFQEKPESKGFKAILIEDVIEKKNGEILIVVRNIGEDDIPKGKWGIYIEDVVQKKMIYQVKKNVDDKLEKARTMTLKIHKLDLLNNNAEGDRIYRIKVTGPGGTLDIYRKEIILDRSIKKATGILGVKRVLVDEDRDGLIDRVYETITEAVENSPINSLIIAGPGEYDESILLTKPFTITSGPKGNVVIKGSVKILDLPSTSIDLLFKGIMVSYSGKPVIVVSNSNNNYQGDIVFDEDMFVISSELDGDYAIKLENKGTGIIILNNTIIDSTNLTSSRIDSKIIYALSNILVHNLTMHGTPTVKLRGINLNSITNSTIEESFFNNTYNGIYSQFSSNLVIINNTFNNNNHNWIYIDDNTNVTIINNTFMRKGGISVYSSNNITISKNNVLNLTSTFGPASAITLKNDEDTNITENKICCANKGVTISPGFSDKNILITNNTFMNITWNAMYLSQNQEVEFINFSYNEMIDCNLNNRGSFLYIALSDNTTFHTDYIHYNTFNDTLGGRTFIIIYHSNQKTYTSPTNMFNATSNYFYYNTTIEKIEDKILDACDNSSGSNDYGYIDLSPHYKTSDTC